MPKNICTQVSCIPIYGYECSGLTPTEYVELDAYALELVTHPERIVELSSENPSVDYSAFCAAFKKLLEDYAALHFGKEIVVTVNVINYTCDVTGQGDCEY